MTGLRFNTPQGRACPAVLLVSLKDLKVSTIKLPSCPAGLLLVPGCHLLWSSKDQLGHVPGCGPFPKGGAEAPRVDQAAVVGLSSPHLHQDCPTCPSQGLTITRNSAVLLALLLRVELVAVAFAAPVGELDTLSLRCIECPELHIGSAGALDYGEIAGRCGGERDMECQSLLLLLMGHAQDYSDRDRGAWTFRAHGPFTDGKLDVSPGEGSCLSDLDHLCLDVEFL